MSRELPLCVCCGRPRQPTTGKDRCGACRVGKCPRCRDDYRRRRKSARVPCPGCGTPCWPGGAGKPPRCFDCAMRQAFTDRAQGPYLCESPAFHELHRRAMAGIPLFNTPRSDRE